VIAKRDNDRQVLRFHGAPTALEALVPQALLGDGDRISAGDRIGATLELGPEAVAEGLELQSAPAGAGALWLQLSLPETTPPGTYEGTVTVGTTSYAITADVAAETNVLLAPGFVRLSAAPGARPRVTFTVANTGNVPYEIPRKGAFGLFEEEGVEDAIGAALRQEAGGEQRLDRFADELADRHGGLMMVAIGAGRGILNPGEVRDMEATFRIPDALKAGRAYSGVWALANVRCKVDVDVVAP
jgi:hypothetical protein